MKAWERVFERVMTDAGFRRACKAFNHATKMTMMTHRVMQRARRIKVPVAARGMIQHGERLQPAI